MSTPTINREAISSALFARVSAVPGLVTTSRTLKHWNDVPAELQPALFQAQRDQQISRVRGAPPVRRIPFDLYLYVRAVDDTPPSTLLNAFLDAIEAALAPDNDMTGRNTLGGLVHDCIVDGTIETDEGTLGQQAVAIVPVLVLIEGY